MILGQEIWSDIENGVPDDIGRWPDTYSNMDPPSFLSWLYRKENRPDRHITQADKIVPLLQQAGPGGMTRRQLGGTVDLAADILDDLLTALVRSGMVTLDQVGGVPHYRV